MFKERFFLGIEIPPKRLKKRYRPSERVFTPEEKSERMRNLKEQEEKAKQDAENVADDLLNELELMGIRCEKCGRRNAKENEDLSLNDKDYSHLFCLDCGHVWKEPKKHQ